MTTNGPMHPELRLLALAPTAKDGELTKAILARSGIECHTCVDLNDICSELRKGAGVLLLAEEAIIQESHSCLERFLHMQEPWSDLPILVLARPGADSAAVARSMDIFGNVTVLERPTRVATLVSAVRAAIRARQRQYQIREHLKRIEMNERELTDFFSNAAIGIHWIGADDKIIRVNQTELDMLGYTRDEFLGHSVADFHVSPAEVERLLARLRKGESLWEFSARMRRKDGQIIDVLINANSSIVDGKFELARCFVRDVTELKQMHEVQGRLAAIVESSVDAIIGMSLEGVIQSWNAAAQRLFGFSSEEAVGQHISLIIPEDHLHDEEELLARLNSGERVEHFETVRRRKDGQLLLVSLTVSPIWDRSGRLIGASKISRDITERVRAESALRESEERFRMMANATPAMIWTADPNGVITFHNYRWIEYTGLAVNGDAQDWPSLALHPHDHERWDEAWKHALKHGSDFEIEVRNRRPDGEYRWFLTRATPRRNANGQIVEWYGSSTDIHDRKQAELELRIRARQQQAIAKLGELALREHELSKLFNSATVAVTQNLKVEFGMVLQLLPEENRFLLNAGVGWKEGLVGKAKVSADGDSLPGYTLLNDKAVVVEDLRLEGRFRGPELLFEYGLTSGMSCIIRRPDASPWGVLAILSSRRVIFTEDDVSFLTAVANILGNAIYRESTEAELKDADRRKDEFIAILAHELRNPLAPLRNGLQVIRLAGDDSQAVAAARTMMDRQLGHMVRLVDDLLDISRISRNKLELRKSPVLLSDVVNSAVETVRTMIDDAGQVLDIDLPKKPITLLADFTRLAQVFGNLLSNAAKYTQPGGRLSLSATVEGNQVVVRIHDSGIGIPKEALLNIFDMFSQLDRSTEKSTGGLGIGLALVRGLIEMHGGTVEAASPGLGHGSTFTVRLPSLIAMDEALPTDDNDSTLFAETNGSHQRILVVDDSRDSAISLSMMLKLIGYDVETAYDGEEAIRVADSFRPHLILMDVGMPRLNGYQATMRIREQPWSKNILIIALTGWGQDADRVKSREAGCDGHLVKPVNLPDLEKLLNEMLPKAVA